MNKDNVIIAALSAGIVVVIVATVVIMSQSSKKLPADSGTALSTAAVTISESAATAAATSALQEATATVTSALQTVMETQKATPSPTPTLTTTSTLATVETSSPTPAPAIEDGSYNVYITSVSAAATDADSQGTITIRVAQIYGGEEAIAQAKADGNADLVVLDENGIEYIPNDYYISDMGGKEIVLPVLVNCSIRVIPSAGPDIASDDLCIDGTLQNLSDDAAEYEQFATMTVAGGYVSYVGEFYLP